MSLSIQIKFNNSVSVAVFINYETLHRYQNYLQGTTLLQQALLKKALQFSKDFETFSGKLTR